MGWQNRVASQPTLKKTPAAATQRKLKMIPVRIRFESDSNRIRTRFEPRCCTTRHMHKNAEKEERKRKRINTLDSYLNAKTKNTTHQRAR